MERCNARTMEIYRRLGIAEQVRDAGLPRTAPMDVFLALSMAGPPLVHLPYPSVAEATAEIAAHNDGGLLEPYQLISQYTLEPLLRSIVETLPTVTVRFGCELVEFSQDAANVTAVVRASRAADETIRASYLVGCDGGSSTVRKQLGIRLQGDGNIRKLRQALFRCDDLYEKIPMGKGRHYHIAEGPLFPFIILQDSTRHWTLHAGASSDAEMAEIFKKSLAMPIDFEMLSVNEWTQHLLCAERYGEGRVFVAGDAAHLVIPTGGLGMNTGVGDAVDLSWKLAATLAGWGGPQLLASYEAERRPIGLRNVKASRAAMTGRLGWRAAYDPNINDDTPEGAATRTEVSALFDTQQRKVTEILGIEAGYRYVDSPTICREPGEGPDPDNPSYVPTTWPGARLPHVWLSDGTALHDRLGPGYSLAPPRRNSCRYFESGAFVPRNPCAARCPEYFRPKTPRNLSIRSAPRPPRFARRLARQQPSARCFNDREDYHRPLPVIHLNAGPSMTAKHIFPSLPAQPCNLNQPQTVKDCGEEWDRPWSMGANFGGWAL